MFIYNNNKIQNNIYLLIPPLLVSLTLYFSNNFNFHGDHIFFKELYIDYYNSSFKDIFYHYYDWSPGADPIKNYSSSEDFFKLIFFIFAKLNVNYNIILTLFHFLLFFSFFIFLNYIKTNKLLIISIFATNFYLTSIGLGSIKNCLALSFFFFSIIFFKNSKNFLYLLFYVFSTLISIYLSILYLFLAILYLDLTKNFLKNNSILKILILILPVLLQYNLIFGKIGGYNSQVYFNENKIGKDIIEDKKKKNINYDVKNIVLTTNSKKFKHFINLILEKKSIELFRITLKFVPERFGKIDNKKVFLNYSWLDIIKFILINILLYFFVGSKNLILFSVYVIISFLIFIFINFERMTLFGFIIYITSLVFTKKNIIKNSLQYYLILLVCSYGFIKTILLILNLNFYNEIY